MTEALNTSPQADPQEAGRSPPVGYMLRRSAPKPATNQVTTPPRQRKMFPRKVESVASIKAIASPETGDPAARSFRTSSRNVSSGLVPTLNLAAIEAPCSDTAQSQPSESPGASARNRESVEFKAAISGQAASDLVPSCAQYTPGRVLPEKVWEPIQHRDHHVKVQSGSLGPDYVPMRGAGSAAPPAPPSQADRQPTLIVPGLGGSDETAAAHHRKGFNSSPTQCPWAPCVQPVPPPAAPSASVACAAMPLSRTFATYNQGPLQGSTARYGRHLAVQEAQEHHVRLSGEQGGLRTAQWSRRYVAPGNPLFANLRFPVDDTLVRAPATEYAKSYSKSAPGKARA